MIRIGIGYDSHRFDPARPLMLGGVRVADRGGLAGHSDADVLLHALVDAVLGAMAAGDIGSHFPNTDPAWAGASSAVFAERARRLAAARGWRIAQLDATLIAEAPRLAPWIDAMRGRVAELFGLDPDGVGIKAKTNEKMGWIGRGEGMAAIAVANLERLSGRGAPAAAGRSPRADRRRDDSEVRPGE